MNNLCYWDHRLTFDGVMTLVAGVIAFIAVLHQIKKAREHVELQINSERQTREQEALQSRKALAQALSVEIRGFQDSYFKEVSDAINAVEKPTGSGLQPLKVFAPPTLPLYVGNASRIGEFRAKTSSAVATFYGSAYAFVGTLEILKASHTWEVEQNRTVEDRADCVRQFEKMKKMLPVINSAAKEALELLGQE